MNKQYSYEEMGLWKHLSTGSEYPDSPCGMTDNMVYSIKEITCPQCKDSLIKRARNTLKILAGEPE